MNKSHSEIASSSFTHRIKTERNNTQASELHINTPTSSHRTNPENSSYMKVAISKTHISFNRGYLDLKRKQKEKKTEETKIPKTFENNKFIVFKNLQEFEVNIQAQKGKIQQKQSLEKSYGIATFKGIHKNVNTHQINLHLGEVTVFALLEAYDGNLAALTLKKRFTENLLEYFRRRKSSQREQSFPIIEQSIKYSIETAQRQLSQLQAKAEDNSGTSLISLIIHDGVIYAANCGSSSIYCSTMGGKMIKLAVAHTTNNESEVDRIVRAGGRLYQTIVNVPFKKVMNITGPLRIFPSGLTVTRTIGKSVQRSRQKTQYSTNKSIASITNTPQIQYIPESQVQWIAIVSSKVNEFVKQERMRDIIEQEMTKRSPNYEDSQVSSHICKRILLEAVESGATESLSAIIILFNVQNRQPLPLARHQQVKELVVQTPKKIQTPPTLTHQPRSLTYIGKRKNFVQQIKLE